MRSKIPFAAMAPGVGWFRFWLPLLAVLHFSNAHADCPPQNGKPGQNIAMTCALLTSPPCQCGTSQSHCAPNNPPWPRPDEATYGASPGAQINAQVSPTGNIPNAIGLTWSNASNSVAPECSATAYNKLTINPSGQQVNISGVLQSGDVACFTLSVTGPPNSPPCHRDYYFHAISGGTGLGDPHMTTVDGVHYDFQGAGEFTALRGKEFERGEELERGKGLEIQTRQTPVPTAAAFPAIPENAYTGLSSCVSIYTAVAARVGKHRVSYQPNISGDPDPSGMQLWVDGRLTKLGPEGIDLPSEGPSDEDEDERARRGKYQPRQHSTAPAQGAIVKPPSAGRIVQSPAGGGIEIHYADGTKLVVTPAWWPDQQKWYLDVTVSETTATKGIMGLTKDGWLPALPHGKSLGRRPALPHDRYVQVYEKFADAWRVTEDTSLFHYARGTSTRTFTNRNWPGFNPSSCTIEGEPTAQPIDVDVAKKHCSAVVDENNKANCIFDVSVTGNPGFAETYQISERLQPGLTETTVKDDTDPTKIGDSVTFTATVLPALARGGGVPAGNVQFMVDGSKAGDPVTLDTIGRAKWSTSTLVAGEHHVVATYNPTGFGERFLASSSPKICHTVEEPIP
jgi:hypothetical protein